MSSETTTKHLVVHVGDKVIVTDINICQRVLPATIEFKGIEQVVKHDVALEVADSLEDAGVIVTGRPI